MEGGDPNEANINVPEEELPDFETGKSATKVWLVKLPKFLAEKIDKIGSEKPGEELGSLRIYEKKVKGPHGDPVEYVTLSVPEKEWSKQVPKSFELKFTNMHPVNEYAFSTDSTGKPIEITGKVQHEATVTPIIDDAYRKIMQKRNAEASTSTRMVKMMDDRKAAGRRLIASASGGTWDLFPARKKQHVEKRERMPRDELIDVLFQCFNEYPYWSFKGLVEKTNQPQTYLREVLPDISILNKRGPYSGMYELKSEYKGGEPAS